MIPKPIDGGQWSATSPLWATCAWAFEPKWDGFRAIVHATGLILSRHGKPLRMAAHHGDAGTQLCRALGAQWLDCELLGVRDANAPYLPLMVLDAAIDGDYLERRKALERAIPTSSVELPTNGIWLTPYSERGGEVWRAWQDYAHIEGVVAKPINSTYPCRSWVKFRYNR